MLRALEALPEASEENAEKRRREDALTKYTEDVIAYAMGDIDHLEIIPSVEPWNEERIREDFERIINNPTRLDRVRAFFLFCQRRKQCTDEICAHARFLLPTRVQFRGQRARGTSRAAPSAGSR